MSFQVSKKTAIREGLQFPLDELTEHQKKLLVQPEGIDGPEFDHRVHIVDGKTGALLKYQPYRLVKSKNHDNTVSEYYVRRDERGIERKYSAKGLVIEPSKNEK